MADIENKILSLLHKVVKEQNVQDYDIKLKEISSGGANYTSKLFTAAISSKNKEELHLFVKVAAMGEKMRNCGDFKIYDVENFVYTELHSKFKVLEASHGIPEKDRLNMCKLYAASTVYLEEIMVLENLAARGFSCHDRMKSVDWVYAASASRELAKLHALSMALREEKPEEFNRFLEYFKYDTFEFEGMDVFFENSKSAALKVVSKEHVDKLANFFKDLTLADVFDAYKCDKNVIFIHGDFRPSNMLHRELDDGSVEVIPVDYQTLRGGCLVVDLLYFIFTGTDKQFRAHYYQRLIDHYYSELSAAMVRLGLDPEEKYSRADFDAELEEKLPFGLGIAVFTLPIVTVEAENAPQVGEDMQLSDFSIQTTGSLFPDRLNGVVDDFVSWGII